MRKHTEAVKSVLSPSFRLDPSIVLGDTDVRDQIVFAFPSQHRLIITATNGVYIWDIYGITEIFHSGSKGIVAAKRIASGGEMLAVADSEVVVLHECNGGLQKSYRLKGSVGRLRLLKYDKESKNLFFTTTLQNSVQSYSLQQSKLLDPSHFHPSPPSVFAISCNSQFLLSTSVAPPTIYLTDLLLHTPPVLLRPYCSSSSVVAAAFHPDREDFFLLAFADGTAAVFDALHFFRNYGERDRQTSDAASGSGGEIAFIKGLHTAGTSNMTPPCDDGVNFDGFDPGTGVAGIGSKATGITAVGFVPGRSATAVTVGADGKCCVVDFTQLTKHKAVLLRSWHVRRPATSLSIICSSQRSTPGQLDGMNDAPLQSHGVSTEDYYIAIGREDGRVLLFNLDGKRLGNQTLGSAGSRIIDLEWTPIDKKLNNADNPQREATPTVGRLPLPNGKGKSSRKSASLSAPSPSDGPVPVSSDRPRRDVNPLLDFSTSRKGPKAFHSQDPDREASTKGTFEFEAFSSSTPSSLVPTSCSETPPTANHVPTTASQLLMHQKQVSESATDITSATHYQVSLEESFHPLIPPRPSPKPGGRLSKRRSQTAQQARTYLDIVSDTRGTSSNQRVSRAVIGPCNGPTPKSQAGTPPAPMSPNTPEDDRNKAALEPPRHDLPTLPKYRAPEPFQCRSKISSPASDSVKSYKTASSRLPSEASDDTVIDWSVGLQRQPVPSLQESAQHNRIPRPDLSKQKGHISLSVSSTSRDTSTPLNASSNDNASPTLSALISPPEQLLPMLQITHPSNEWQMQKGHISGSVSADSTDTLTPVSVSPDDQILQWPSLKKSPRIPELHKGLQNQSLESSPDTVKDSVTGIVLKGYTMSNSPSKAPTRRQTPFSLPSTTINEGPESRPCACAATLGTTIEASLSIFRAEILQQFDAQRTWFEGVMRGEEKKKNRMALENRWLRNELARFEKEKGIVGVDERGLRIRDV